MGDVFISYAREDVAFVRRLYALLAGQGRDPWVDWNDIPPTADWLVEIYSAIEAVDGFIFVISPDSCVSTTCQLEVEHAVQNHKRLVPILYRDVEQDDVPAPLAKLNWILFYDGEDPESAASLLADALDADLDWIRAHTRLLVRSIEWEREARDGSLLLRGDDLRRALEWLTRASETTKPAPTTLQIEYVRMSQEAEARELERVRRLYERALASTLVAQSRRLQVARLGALPLAMALGIESMRRSPSSDAEEVLRRCIVLQPERVARFVHDYRVSVIAFSPKGDVLATASGSLSERESFEAEARGKSLEDFVDEADLQRFLKRQDEIADDVTGNVAYLWEPLTGVQLARLEHSGSVMTVAFSADGSRLATGATDGTAKVWESPSGRMISCVDLARSLWQGTLALSTDGSLLIAREGDDEASAWDVHTGRQAPRHALAEATAAALTHAEDERRRRQRERVTGSLRRLRRPELEEGEARLGISVRADSTKEDLVEGIASTVLRRAFALSPDALRFADAHRFTSDSDAVSVYDLLGSEHARVAPGGFVAAAAFHPSGRYLCTAAGSAVELWNLETEITLRFLRSDHDVGFLAFSRDGGYLVTADEKRFHDIAPRGEVWNVASGKRAGTPLTEELRSLLAAATDSWNVASPDSRLIAMRQEPGRVVRIRDRADRRIVAKLTHEGWVMCAAFGPVGLLATGTDLGAHVWDARSGREIAALYHPKQVRSVALDATGKLLATACDDNAARIWDVESGREVLVVRHDHIVGAVAFSPDGTYLATGGDDNTARLWDTATHNEVARLRHESPVRTVRFSPDGQTLATGSLDGEVGLWVCRPDTLVDLACQRLTRNLTPAEWDHYLPDEPYRATCPAADG